MELITLIENAGSDHLPTFGGTFEGGYCIQQNPAEFAGFLKAIEGRKIQSYLQIGSAAGGSERFLCEYVRVFDLTIIDDGRHPKFYIWTDINRPALEAQGVKVTQHVGDSHEQAARDFLESCDKRFDLVGIDGDHTPAGVRMDWHLIQPFVGEGALVWFHDISDKLLPPGQLGSRELWNILKGRYRVIYEDHRQCGIGILEIN